MAKSSSKAYVLIPVAPIHRFARPLQRFIEIESASGVVLITCTLIAMILANSIWADRFHDFWEKTYFVVGLVDGFQIKLSLHHWVNDGLMTLFFFVVGLEIKRELVAGELSSLKKAALPVIAALGGMIVPALVYLTQQAGRPGERGWGIPMATDIAFVVGVLALFGRRVPFGLKIFLLSLAIVDDIGAILVIAAVYSGSPNYLMLAIATGGLLLCYFFNRLGVRTVTVYVIVGAGIWLATFRSGVHPTIAGVLLGLLTPSSAWVGHTSLRSALESALGRLDTAGGPDDDDLKHLEFVARESASPLARLVHALHPWVGFVIMPLFALANAGVPIRMAAITDPVALAVALGLIIGKPIGIFGFSWLAVKVGVAQLPSGVNWRAIAGAGCLGGIGFTMSLFVGDLAFEHSERLLDAAKIGIIGGSVISVILGSILLMNALPAVKSELSDEKDS